MFRVKPKYGSRFVTFSPRMRRDVVVPGFSESQAVSLNNRLSRMGLPDLGFSRQSDGTFTFAFEGVVGRKYRRRRSRARRSYRRRRRYG